MILYGMIHFTIVNYFYCFELIYVITIAYIALHILKGFQRKMRVINLDCNLLRFISWTALQRRSFLYR